MKHDLSSQRAGGVKKGGAKTWAWCAFPLWAQEAECWKRNDEKGCGARGGVRVLCKDHHEELVSRFKDCPGNIPGRLPSLLQRSRLREPSLVATSASNNDSSTSISISTSTTVATPSAPAILPAPYYYDYAGGGPPTAVGCCRSALRAAAVYSSLWAAGTRIAAHWSLRWPHLRR